MTARDAVRGALAAAALAVAGAAAAQGAAGDEIVLGMVAPFSGAAKEMGQAVRTGVEVAFAAQNAAGGVGGRRLRLIAMDDGYEPARTSAAMKELVEGKKVFGVIGNVGTPTAAVAVPYANEKGVLFFGAVSGAPLLRNDPPDRYVFNYRASYGEETAAIVRYLVEVRRIAPSEIAVFAQEDAFGDAGFEGVARVMRHYRRDPAKVLRVGYKRNTADVEEAVQGILRHARGLKAVVMVATYKPAARFVEKLKDAGHGRLVFSNVSFVGSNELAEELTQLGPGYADGVVVTQVVPNPLAKASATLRYQKELKANAPGEKPGFLSLEGWVAARLLIEGLQRAGKNVNTEAVVEALEGIKALDLGLGVPLTFAPSEHQASHKIWGTVMDGKGEFRSLELE
ncbi:MAG TPA: ABC transporter substrate-binding protein [Anaeromyxobacter sp.]|nr:ABC transporter substrate-binding protein [Anaeromyxobacter sp.]